MDEVASPMVMIGNNEILNYLCNYRINLLTMLTTSYVR